MCAFGVVGVVGGALGELERRLEQLGRRPLVDRDLPRGVVELFRADAGQAQRAARRSAPRTRPGAQQLAARRADRERRDRHARARDRAQPDSARARPRARATRAPRPRSPPADEAARVRGRGDERQAARAARSTAITPNSARRGTRHHAGSASAKRSSSQSSAASSPHTIPDTPTTGSGLHTRSRPSRRRPRPPSRTRCAAVPSARSTSDPIASSPSRFRTRCSAFACSRLAVTTRHQSPSAASAPVK